MHTTSAVRQIAYSKLERQLLRDVYDFRSNTVCSCCQSLIQLLDDRVQLITEQLVNLPQPAFLRKRRVLEIIWLDTQVRGNVVPNHLQPVPLFLV